MKEPLIILVDEEDNAIGVGKKQEVHELGLLHRAFSVFVFREDGADLKLLMQKRNVKKYHCGGLWTNTCCSHPNADEKVEDAAIRRLDDELMLTGVALTKVGSFKYKAHFDNGLIEHEYDHVFVGFLEEDHKTYNASEIDEIAWMDIEFIKKDIVNNPSKYTPWFNQAFSLALQYVQGGVNIENAD